MQITTQKKNSKAAKKAKKTRGKQNRPQENTASRAKKYTATKPIKRKPLLSALSKITSMGKPQKGGRIETNDATQPRLW